MKEKNWETKFEYVNDIIDLLIKSMEDLDIAEIMFQKELLQMLDITTNLPTIK